MPLYVQTNPNRTVDNLSIFTNGMIKCESLGEATTSDVNAKRNIKLRQPNNKLLEVDYIDF